MTTSLTTFEHRIQHWLLDLLHSQWLALGVPFSVRRARSDEVIDPEALLWCSLEFFPTQPRLLEQVLAWRTKIADSLLAPRFRKFAKTQADPRALLWYKIDQLALLWQSIGLQQKSPPAPPAEPCYGLASVEELQAFCNDFGTYVTQQTSPRHQPGRAESTCAAALLRARDIFSTDVRHFLLIYLLANQSGARLRSIAQWSGQTYQNVAKAAKRWEAAGVVTLDRGFARLKNPPVWADILGLGPSTSQPIVLVNWPRFFDACVTLLRYLAKANAKSLPADGPVVTGLIRQAVEDAAASVESATPSHTVRDFATLLLTLSEKAPNAL